VPRSGESVPPSLRDNPAELRGRATRVRRHASQMTDKSAAERLREFADELEALAGTKESQPDAENEE
jgi:hypothetical protein